jgi:hypothetical protein
VTLSLSYEDWADDLLKLRGNLSFAFRDAQKREDAQAQRGLLVDIEIIDRRLQQLAEYLDPQTTIGALVRNLPFLYKPDKVPDSPADWTNQLPPHPTAPR